MKKPWVDALLAWYGIDVTEDCRLIADRREKWAEVRSTDPPTHPKWTAEDEARLVEKKKFGIDISNTALCREKVRMEHDLDIAATHMSRKDRDELIEKLNAQNDQDDAVQAVAMPNDNILSEHFETAAF